MYPTAFRLPVTLIRNPVPWHDMAPDIIIPPPLNLTVGTTQSSLICSQMRLLTKVGPSLWNIVNLDSSVQRTADQSTHVHVACCLAKSV